MAPSLFLRERERNDRLTAFLKMGNRTRALTACHCCKNCRSRGPAASRYRALVPDTIFFDLILEGPGTDTQQLGSFLSMVRDFC